MTGHGNPYPGDCRAANSPRRRVSFRQGWLLAIVLAAPVPVLARQAPDSQSGLTAAASTSNVHIGTRTDTWNTQWLQWDMRGAGGGVFARAERRSRDTGHGTLGTLGGHWLGRRWIVSGQVESGSGAAFIPERAAQLAIGYRLDNAHVLRAGYRQARYLGSTLHLWSLSALGYRGGDEWELGMRHGILDTPRPQRIDYGLARSQWTCTARWTCGVRLAAGRNVFGADEPGFDTGSGWQAGGFLAYRLRADGHVRLDLDAGRARHFRQNLLMLSYRHAFSG